MNSESTTQQFPTDNRIHVSMLEVKALTSKEANAGHPSLPPEVSPQLEEIMRREDEQHELEQRMQSTLNVERSGLAYSPNDPNEWKVPPTGENIVIEGFSRTRFQTDAYLDPNRIMDLKMQELKEVSTRSREGNKVPPSKSKAAKRKKAKASKMARKQQRRV